MNTRSSSRKDISWWSWLKVSIPVGIVYWTLWQTSTVVDMLSQAGIQFMADVTVMPESPAKVTLSTSQPKFTWEYYFEWGPSSFQVEPKPVRLAPESNPQLCKDPSRMDWSLYQDNILLVPHGNCSFQRKALHAQQMGAAAIIIYNTMKSQYKLNTTISGDTPTMNDIIWPNQGAFDCERASVMLPTKEFSFTPLPYNASHNDPRLSGHIDNLCQQYYQRDNDHMPFHEACPSQRCLMAPTSDGCPTTEEATALPFDFPPSEIRVCCALDRHMSMEPDESMGHGATVKIPVVFATMQQGDDLLSWIVRHPDVAITASLSSRWLPEITSETTLGLSVYFGAVVLLSLSLLWMLRNVVVAMDVSDECDESDAFSWGEWMAFFFCMVAGFVCVLFGIMLMAAGFVGLLFGKVESVLVAGGMSPHSNVLPRGTGGMLFSFSIQQLVDVAVYSRVASTGEDISAKPVQRNVFFLQVARNYGALYAYFVFGMAFDQAAILLSTVVLGLCLSHLFAFVVCRVNILRWQSKRLRGVNVWDLIALAVCYVSGMYVSYRLSLHNTDLRLEISAILLSVPFYLHVRDLQRKKSQQKLSMASVVTTEGAGEECPNQARSNIAVEEKPTP